ncbi:MAG TPA: YbaY family lipoprotein [Gemmatimonadales bacterium]|nr:YbaY family lipoprotein [Gemmatimonadales bacterium]
MSHFRTRAGDALLVLMGLLACTKQTPPPDPRVTPAVIPPPAPGNTVQGTATYRERIAMPSDAVFEATLEDVTRADAPAEVISRIRVPSPGNPPIAFEIRYDPARIVPGNRYAVRARVLLQEQLFFTTDQSYPVTPGAGTSPLQLMLKRPGTSAGASLENTYWKLINLGAEEVHIPAGAREVYLQLKGGQMSGFSGCNSLSGKYEISADQLKLTQMASTMMYCEGPGMAIEKSLNAAVERVARYRIDGNFLELLDEAGTSLAKFESRKP